MKIPKGYRQREAAAKARSRQRLVSEEIRAQRAEFLAQSAGLVEVAAEAPAPVEPIVPVQSNPVVQTPAADEGGAEQPSGEGSAPEGESEGGAEGEGADASEPAKNKGGRPKKA